MENRDFNSTPEPDPMKRQPDPGAGAFSSQSSGMPSGMPADEPLGAAGFGEESAEPYCSPGSEQPGSETGEHRVLDEARRKAAVKAAEYRQEMRVQAEKLKSEARKRAHDLREATHDRSNSAFEGLSGWLAGTLDDISESIRAGAETMESRHHPAASSYATTAAHRLERARDTLRDTDLDYAVEQAEMFGRRHPELLLGGALLIGFALGRFIRSSGRHGMIDIDDPRYQAPAPFSEESWKVPFPPENEQPY